MNRIIISCSVILLSLLLTSCKSLPTAQERSDTSTSLAKQNNWISDNIDTGDFLIRSYFPGNLSESDSLTIFIEGDGLAWLSKRKPSSDPTPISHIVLKAALKHPEPNAIYLARPCQFISSANCSSRFWLKERFAPVVINSMDKAIEHVKKRFNAKELTLVGYSGGGAIAALVASKRTDVTHLITLAGNLDHQAWTDYHKITPLKGSLNPIDYSKKLAQQGVKQTHFVGNKDRVIPTSLVYRFVGKH